MSDPAGFDADHARESLRAEAARLAAVIGARDHEVVDFTPQDNARPFITVADDGTYHWKAVERGELLEHRVTTSRDEVLYWSSAATAARIAAREAARHGGEGEEFRVTMWNRHAELLLTLNPAWAHRWRDELAARLRRGQPEAVALLPELPPGRGRLAPGRGPVKRW